MPSDNGLEIPSPIDFADMEQARAWVVDTIARRPYRSRFFDAFCASLNAHFDSPIEIVELGSGPGHLADKVLKKCRIWSYTAVDFSPAMHEIAREHVGQEAFQLRSILADFRKSDWAKEIGQPDALITMQAAHEVRHKSRLPLLFRQIYEMLRPNGLFLYCDHYTEAGSRKSSELHLSRAEQPGLLAAAGFERVTLLHDEGGMALYAAVRSAS